MREDERRTNRMPELSVTLDGDVEGPQHISQKVTSLGGRTLEDIKKETPLLPLPAKGGRIGPARITMSSQIGILDSLGHKRPVSQWTTEETEGYNRHVQAYYASYARFIEKRVDFERLRLRSFQANLRLRSEERRVGK